MKFFIAVFACILAVCSASGYYGATYLAAPVAKVIAPVPTSVTSRVDTYGVVAAPVAYAAHPVAYGYSGHNLGLVGGYGHGLGYGYGHGLVRKAYY